VKAYPAAATLLQAVAELAELTGSTALKYYRRNPSVEQKQDGSPVTVADREAEQRARAWLAQRFPGDAILGEEFGATPGTTGRTWLLDPVDGTKTYVRGVPLWGSLVAVLEGDVVLAGAAAYPAAGESLAAARGEGCWHDGARCRVSELSQLERATVLTSDVQRFASPELRRGWEALSGAALLVRSWGDCYGYLLVATGRAEAMVDVGLNPWDIACFVPIIREAGGQITDFEGQEYPPLENAVASNAALATEVRRFF
jgi:histidinol-phosphatase